MQSPTTAPLARREDLRLVTGRGRFAADVDAPGQAHACFLRADRASAKIVALDVAPAAAAPGVLAVLTHADVADCGDFWVLVAQEGVVSPLRAPRRPVLARDAVRFVGEPIALVVAESPFAAADAVERIAVAYDDLPSVTDPVAALAPDAPHLYDDVPGNLCYAQSHGDADRTAAALRESAHVVRLTLVNNRLVPSPLEPRAVVASFDPVSGTYRFAMPTQGMPRMQQELADVLRVPRDRVRIDTGDVGGAFGVRTPAYPEYVALARAARRVGRPVKWVATRSETFASEHHARGGLLEGVLGLDGEGRFTALDVRFTCAMGAHLTFKSAFIAATNPGRVLSGVYRIPALHALVRCVLTNTAVIGPYRGSGRPEIATLIERLVDAAAARLGIDRVALRRRNLIAATPWATAHGVTYDSGDFPRALDRALEAADWNGFGARRAASSARGRLRGIGVSCFIESTGGPAGEGAAIRFARDGAIEVHVGTQSSGQGHETVFPRLVARWLGVDERLVRLVQGDHAVAVDSGAAIASRSLVAAGGALKAAADAVLAQAKAHAAATLEVAEHDVSWTGSAFRVSGTDRAIGVAALAARLVSVDGRHPLDADAAARIAPSFPNGCHVCEVEVDPETGAAAVVRYVAVDDFGEVQHHGIVAGQVHGGVAQGLGQALLEHCVYDAAGQLLTGSFADYALPRADDLPAIAVEECGTPAPTHPFGAKGAGESGATGAPAAAMNALLDALGPLGVAHLDMPATPEAVWRAIRRAADPSRARTRDASPAQP